MWLTTKEATAPSSPSCPLSLLSPPPLPTTCPWLVSFPLLLSIKLLHVEACWLGVLCPGAGWNLNPNSEENNFMVGGHYTMRNCSKGWSTRKVENQPPLVILKFGFLFLPEQYTQLPSGLSLAQQFFTILHRPWSNCLLCSMLMCLWVFHLAVYLTSPSHCWGTH